jgi:hypothetical protein
MAVPGKKYINMSLAIGIALGAVVWPRVRGKVGM